MVIRLYRFMGTSRSLVLPTLAQRWPYAGCPMLAQRWPNAGLVMAQCWPNVGTVLAQCWPSVDPVLAVQCWPNAGPVQLPVQPAVQIQHEIGAQIQESAMTFDLWSP